MHAKSADLLVTALLAVLAFGAFYMHITKNSTKAFAKQGQYTTKRMPIMDQRTPERTETATFALG
jgi:hypothetical protein